MFSFKKSLLALVGLFVIVATVAALLPLIGLGQAPKYPFGRPGNFYLTKTKHNGAQALTACAAGYHMASIWEIHDPSNLRYNTALGFTTDDSGLGPPVAQGWIRTGAEVSGGGPLGNCRAWTSANDFDFGKMANVDIPYIDVPVPNMPPWNIFSSSSCNTNNPVWCVQD